MTNSIRSDYSYCFGVACPLRARCERYLPDPPDVPLWWLSVAYREDTGQCCNFSKSKMLLEMEFGIKNLSEI